jgi:hypothetical protein
VAATGPHGAHGDRRQHPQQPQRQRQRRQQRDEVDERERPGNLAERQRVDGPGRGDRQRRSERREPVHQAGTQQRQPTGEPDGLPDEQGADGVAGGPVSGGERPAGRLGEEHAEQEQTERGKRHR